MEFIETVRKETDKAAWLEKRKHYVTGTDAGKLIGVSPYGGMFSVWLDKKGNCLYEDHDNEKLYRVMF